MQMLLHVGSDKCLSGPLDWGLGEGAMHKQNADAEAEGRETGI
jgi:hypothetical protein